MKQRDLYNQELKKLHEAKPIFTNRQLVIDQIMREVKSTPQQTSLWERIDAFLFDWVENVRWRLAMSATLILLLGFFISEQFELQNQLSSLEKHIIQSGYNSSPVPSTMQKVLLNIATKEFQNTDSITVAKDDLKKLLKSYFELQQENESLRTDQKTTTNL